MILASAELHRADGVEVYLQIMQRTPLQAGGECPAEAAPSCGYE